MRSQSPFQSLRLGIVPRTPSTLGRGEHQVRFDATWANTWAVDDNTFDPENGSLGLYLLDYESLDLNLAYDYGISDTVDVALSASAARRFGSFYVYLTVGYAWYGSDAVAGLELDSNQTTVLAAGEWRFKPTMSLMFQYLGTEGVATDLGVFSDVSHEVVLGWKWEVRPNGVLEIGFIENIIEFDNSPDFGVHAGWTQRF
jgi:hypothetical protein